ncbi:hypothetical protein KIK15_15415 [Williamsia sp. CHRR-6]|nr:hypothetical protein [Williamsia sp. CHRR-6]
MGKLIIVAAVVFALIVLAGGLWFAFDSSARIRRFARSTDLIPGRPGRAPKEWATSDTREAILHRRIRYAIATVHENPAVHADDVVGRARERLDEAVFALDDRLIAAAAAADDKELTRVGYAVDNLESLAGKLIYATPDDAASAVDASIAFLEDPRKPVEPDADESD